jgi:phosphonate transport system permease protein
MNGTELIPAAGAILQEDRRRRRNRAALWGGVAVLGLACLLTALVIGPDRTDNLVQVLTTLAAEMWPPDFSRWREWVPGVATTLLISVAGTVLAVIVSVPLGLLAARETTPHPSLYHASRWVIAAFRSIPELVWAVLLVAAVGFGALSGVLALGLHSIGMLGKFFAETVEHADPGPITYARATGAGTLVVFAHVILPIVLPRWMDVIVYRWEHNIRASTVLGMVGAGGIGLELVSALKLFDYQTASALLLVILALVVACEYLGAWLRKALSS